MDYNQILMRPSFVLPCTSPEEERRLLDQFSGKVLARYELGLVIGRFQPLHYGHLFLIKQALTIANKIIIGIGSSNVVNHDNPFSLQHRQQMLAAALEKEKEIAKRIIRITPLPDFPDDDVWMSETIKRVGKVDATIGNNDWVNGIFEKHGIPVVRTSFYFREIYEGKKIRSKLRYLTAISLSKIHLRY